MNQTFEKPHLSFHFELYTVHTSRTVHFHVYLEFKLSYVFVIPDGGKNRKENRHIHGLKHG